LSGFIPATALYLLQSLEAHASIYRNLTIRDYRLNDTMAFPITRMVTFHMQQSLSQTNPGKQESLRMIESRRLYCFLMTVMAFS